MRPKTRKLIADIVNGVFRAFVALLFIPLILLLLFIPIIATHYTGSSWGMLLLVVVIPIAVGVMSAVTQAIVDGD